MVTIFGAFCGRKSSRSRLLEEAAAAAAIIKSAAEILRRNLRSAIELPVQPLRIECARTHASAR